jgi:prepilin-type N-terminal cleavage/methylation domain-containing protein
MIFSKDDGQNGFTIVELMIAVAVASIASILITYAFVFMYGGLVKEQARSNMVLESQLYLKRMVEDIRVANQILTTNSIADSYEPSGGWVTNDPANILVLTQPAVDQNEDFIYDSATGYPYQNEIVYFGDSKVMYRRTLANTNAVDNRTLTTCPSGTSGCPPDVVLTDRLQNMLFVFYDINDAITTVPEDARSVELTVNLSEKLYGETINVSNTTRVTLRNEN